jgi:hypothetical protein
VGLLAKKPHGIKRSWKNIDDLREKYVTPGIDLLRLNIPVLNPSILSNSLNRYALATT